MALIALDRTVQLVTVLAPLCRRLATLDKNLVGQLRRCATSIGHNLAEGAERVGAERRHHFRIALGSAAETAAGLRIAVAWGYVTDEQVAPAMELLGQVRALCLGLLR